VRRLFPALAVVAVIASVAYAQSRDLNVAPLPRAVSETTVYGASWAVIIGVNDYQHPRVPKLRYAVNDARSMERELLNQGFLRDRVIMLVDRQATKAAIERVIGDELRTRMGREDRLLVFFAGHGKTDRLRSGEEEGFLLPVDGDPSAAFSTAISMTALRQISDRLPAKHVLYVIDACYSGYAVFNRSISDDLLEEMIKKPAIQILTAGRQEDQAQERDGHGVFTLAVLQGIRGEAFSGKSWLSLEELGIWVKQRVYAESNRRQLPQYGSLSGQGQFVFFRGRETTPSAPPIVAAVAPPAPTPPPAAPKIREEPRRDLGGLSVKSGIAGVDVWLDEQKIGETRAGRLLIVSELQAGSYRLRARKPGYDEWERTITVEPNKTIGLTIDIQPSSTPPPPAVAALPPAPGPVGPSKAIGGDAAPMVFVPSGPFLMGAPADDARTAPSEKPQRTVVVSDFWIDQYEVTNALYKKFRDATRYRAPTMSRDPRFMNPNQPVVGVSWEDATEYCRWAGKRLPTEAEWEKAARGTDGRMLPWTAELNACPSGNCVEGRAHLAATRPADVGTLVRGASPYGALDMAGNVWEWVQDWFDLNAYRKDPNPTNPKGPAMGGEKVLKGGSFWEREVTALRVTARHHQPPDRAHNNVGFRCAMSGPRE
jgi:formylglycine-generating enzyme required for sulfatase activity